MPTLTIGWVDEGAIYELRNTGRRNRLLRRKNSDSILDI